MALTQPARHHMHETRGLTKITDIFSCISFVKEVLKDIAPFTVSSHSTEQNK